MQTITLFSCSREDVHAFELAPTNGAKKHSAPLTLRFTTMEGLNSDGMTVTRPLELCELRRLKVLIEGCLDEHSKRAAARCAQEPPVMTGPLEELLLARRGVTAERASTSHTLAGVLRNCGASECGAVET